LFGQSLVVAQVAVSVILLAAAGLFVRHLSNLRTLDLGFARDRVLLVTLNPAESGASPDQLAALYPDLLARLQAIPGVRPAALSAITPIQASASTACWPTRWLAARGRSAFVSRSGLRPDM
jgi:hypothetical protein